MSVITITISIEIPEGAAVALSGTPGASVPTPTPVVAPGPSYVPSQGVHEMWPAGSCPKHHKPWTQGTYGPYCTAKDESGPKGYCILKPGDLFQGKAAA